MKSLLLNHEGWEVVTCSWSAAAKPGRLVELVYTWGPDGISFFDSRVSTARMTLQMTMQEFLDRLSQPGACVDLRRWC